MAKTEQRELRAEQRELEQLREALAAIRSVAAVFSGDFPNVVWRLADVALDDGREDDDA